MAAPGGLLFALMVLSEQPARSSSAPHRHRVVLSRAIFVSPDRSYPPQGAGDSHSIQWGYSPRKKLLAGTLNADLAAISQDYIHGKMAQHAGCSKLLVAAATQV